MSLHALTAHQLSDLYAKGECAPRDVVTALFARHDAVEEKVRAFALCDRERIMARARALEQGKPKGRLWGIPIAIKDNICVKDELTRCCSRILDGFRPPYNATVIELLEAEGAILFGKANMDEFAFGSSTENSCLGPTHNPWDLTRIPGGSSGGSAAAVAADETIMAVGSDTGGSIRQPASVCGVVGGKPTYGSVSRYGLIAFASSLDQIGPLTKDVRDAALLLSVLSAHDTRDSTSAPVARPDYSKVLGGSVKGLRIAVPSEYFIDGISPDVRTAVEDALAFFKVEGAVCEEVSLPATEYAVADYYVLATAEASSNLARFDGVQYGARTKEKVQAKNPIIDLYSITREEALGDEAKRRILLGTYVLSSGYYDAYYLRAQKVRTLIQQDFERVFKQYDCVITPTSPTTAFKLGERTSDPLQMYLSDIFTISANLAGIPAWSVPCGFDAQGLPIGLQILAKPFDEETIFRAAYCFEQGNEWRLRRAQIQDT